MSKVKLKNRTTGLIGELQYKPEEEYPFTVLTGNSSTMRFYKKIAYLYADWSDYEEPKGIKEIFFTGATVNIAMSCQEEAEKAVEKLKTWKRLKDKGFRFNGWYQPDGCDTAIVVETNIDYNDVDNRELKEDLDLLFRGEE